MACFFLGSSIIFPLGDFSLTRDLPQMYRNYSKITTADELSVLDFVGDYLLHGKDLLGHNQRDKQQNPTNNVQFQHQPNAVCVVLVAAQTSPRYPSQVLNTPTVSYLPVLTTDFHDDLFRPPLV